MENQNLNKSSRRNFLKKSSYAGIGLSTTFIPSYKQSTSRQEQKELGELNGSSKKLLSLFNLKYPFFQAAPGGEKLAVAIANAGGMGCVGLGWQSTDDAYETTLRMNKTTNGNYYANYLLHFDPNSFDKAIEAGCMNFQF